MKDYYDIYFFLTKLKNEINQEIFKKALDNTITQRDSLDYLRDYKIILDDILQNDRMHSNWNSYRKKTKYAENIEFNIIIKLLKEFIDNTRK